jgi:isopentenyldiphosphate isomerase
MNGLAGIGPMSEELFEIVDDEGRVVGTAPRWRCHGDPSLAHRSVHVFVINPRGDIYLQKRSSAKDVQPGKWDTSVGGHLAPGETYEQAAVRELAEELGIRAGAGLLLPRHSYVWRTSIETEHVRTYELSYQGAIAPDPVEIDSGRFWSEDEIRRECGRGTFTPNLEHELRLLGVVAGHSGS